MDREERREIRKRGAASRQLTSSNIVIKTPKRAPKSTPKRRRSSSHTTKVATPKWKPVSQDSGALITEELSLANSPLTPRESARKVRQPVTPKEGIIEDYEPRVRREVGKSKKAKVEQKKEPKAKPKAKSKGKPTVKSKGNKVKKPISKPPKEVPKTQQEYKEDYEYQDENRFQTNLPIDESQDEDIDDLYSLGSKEIKISRLPTSMARLTSIDLVIQSLDESLESETQKHFINFQKLNESYFNKTLDLNLTNNRNIGTLRDLKSEKFQLRRDLFNTRQEINENLRKLEQIRTKYNETKKQINKRRKINKNLENLSQPSNNDSILTKINNLNNIIDPNYGFLEKLKQLNSKFYEVEE